jgi:hypothetical protein
MTGRLLPAAPPPDRRIAIEAAKDRDPLRPQRRSISSMGAEGPPPMREWIDMRSFTIAAVLALLGALGTSGLSLATDERPFSGEFAVGVVGVEQRCGAGALTIGFAGSGVASHLGRITGTGSNCTGFDLAAAAVPIYDGIASFIAADGSTLTFAYEGEQQAPVNLRATTTTTNTVIGGTGRFAGAAGTWTTVGSIDFVTGVFEGSFSGWISY